MFMVSNLRLYMSGMPMFCISMSVLDEQKCQLINQIWRTDQTDATVTRLHRRSNPIESQWKKEFSHCDSHLSIHWYYKKKTNHQSPRWMSVFSHLSMADRSNSTIFMIPRYDSLLRLHRVYGALLNSFFSPASFRHIAFSLYSDNSK